MLAPMRTSAATHAEPPLKSQTGSKQCTRFGCRVPALPPYGSLWEKDLAPMFAHFQTRVSPVQVKRRDNVSLRLVADLQVGPHVSPENIFTPTWVIAGQNRPFV